MRIERELKVLYANLKRLSIGRYLHTKDFRLFTIESDFDEEWNGFLDEVNSNNKVISISHHNTEVEEEAFLNLMAFWLLKYPSNFGEFITAVLFHFAKWNPIKLDLNKTYDCLKELDIRDSILLEFIKETRKIRDSKPDSLIETDAPQIKKVKINKNNIFIVHGHDDSIKNEVARFIQTLGYNPIILHEQASSGKTIIEKIESYSNVGFGVVLYSPCDIGSKMGDENNLKKRARQNVVFEHGYLIGKIGRENVCALVKDNIEKPNDISGVVYITIENDWKIKLAKELRNSGYIVDMNLAI